MPTIRIDDDVYEALKRLAVPFEDSPNDVIRGLVLGENAELLAEKPPEPKRVRRTGATAKEVFWIPILRVLQQLGGRGETGDVLDRIERDLGKTLNDADRETISSGMIRWRNRAQWARKDMVDAGLLKPDSPHGLWEITEKGRKYFREQTLAAAGN